MKLLQQQEILQQFETCVYQNTEIISDNFNRKSLKLNNVFGILYEEQQLAWELYSEELKKSINNAIGEIDFLEVGSGSGFWSILFKKYIGGNVFAIDKNLRAVRFTKMNAMHNKINIKVKHETYNLATTTYNSAKSILLNPPFHIYPVEIEKHIPLFARGGFDGQREFKNQLLLADYHLAKNGIIVFIMMCLGNRNVPEYCKYIPKIMDPGISIYWSNIFEPIETYVFLKQVYDNKFKDFIEKISRDYPKLFFTNGVIIKDKMGAIENKIIKCKKPVSWINRISLHKNINQLL